MISRQPAARVTIRRPGRPDRCELSRPPPSGRTAMRANPMSHAARLFHQRRISPPANPMPAMVAARTSDRDHRTERNCDVCVVPTATVIRESVDGAVHHSPRPARPVAAAHRIPAPVTNCAVSTRSLRRSPNPAMRGELRRQSILCFAQGVHDRSADRTPRTTVPLAEIRSRQIHDAASAPVGVISRTVVSPAVQAEGSNDIHVWRRRAFRPVGRSPCPVRHRHRLEADAGHRAVSLVLVTEIRCASAIPACQVK